MAKVHDLQPKILNPVTARYCPQCLYVIPQAVLDKHRYDYRCPRCIDGPPISTFLPAHIKGL